MWNLTAITDNEKWICMPTKSHYPHSLTERTYKSFIVSIILLSVHSSKTILEYTTHFQQDKSIAPAILKIRILFSKTQNKEEYQ